jgi:hypothetical protein
VGGEGGRSHGLGREWEVVKMVRWAWQAWGLCWLASLRWRGGS